MKNRRIHPDQKRKKRLFQRNPKMKRSFFNETKMRIWIRICRRRPGEAEPRSELTLVLLPAQPPPPSSSSPPAPDKLLREAAGAVSGSPSSLPFRSEDEMEVAVGGPLEEDSQGGREGVGASMSNEVKL